MTYQLDPQSESIIAMQMTGGQFSCAEEVIKESLKLLELREQKRRELRERIDRAANTEIWHTLEDVEAYAEQRL